MDEKELINKVSVEPHKPNASSKLNWLRASVLGANDGIVSVAGLVLGVAGATDAKSAIFTAGLAGIVSAAISMAAGEYVSVSSARDAENALLNKERDELKNEPEHELAELASIYEKRGLTKQTALIVAKELSAKDVRKAHFDAELGIDPEHLTNPWQSAFASSASFVFGAIIPFAAILMPSADMRVPVTFISVIIALTVTGTVSAKVGGANVGRAIIRVVGGGALAMAVTYSIGRLFGVAGI